MNIKEVAKRLKYKNVSELLEDNNITASNISHIKTRSQEKYQDIINKIILKRYNIDTLRLLELLDRNETTCMQQDNK